MKILAIRGENIASLSEFSLDLATGPLANQGLYMIWGPTGSGKTALLDAMCLALFDKTPRFRERGGVDILDAGNASALPSRDVRHYLRKGAVSGYAEVDFEGIDGGRYRARWSVQRARKQRSGKIQSQKLSLEDLTDDKPLGDHKKTETLTTIQEKLGLGFDQFCRSVLLAQGELAAFLREGDKGRAELLERMTGTEIYGALSRAAHERATVEREKSRLLQRDREQLDLLDEETRVALEDERTQATARLESLERERASLEAGLTWYDRQTELREAVEKAETEQARSRERLEEQQARKPLMDKVEALLSIAPLFETEKRAIAELEHISRDLEKREAAKAEAEQVVLDRGEAEKAAVSAHEIAERAWREAEPDLERARRLDSRIEDRLKRLEDLEKLSAESTKRIETETASLEAIRAEEKTLRADLEDRRVWLETHETWQPIASRWDDWQDRLTELIASRETNDRRAAALDAITDEVAAAGKQCESAEQAVATALREKERGAAEEARARVRAAGFDLESLRHDKKALVDRLDTLTALREWLRGLAEITANRDRTRAALTEKQKLAEDLAERLAVSEKTSRTIRDRLAEAKRALTLIEATVSLADRRVQLTEGEPCPLCGATDHPYATREGPGQSALDEQRTRVEALEADVAETTREQVEKRTRLEETERAIASSTEQVAELDSRETDLRKDRPTEVEGVDSVDAAERSIGECRAAVQRVEDGIREAELAAEAARVASEALRELTETLDSARERVREQTETRHTAQKKEAELRSAAESTRAELDRLVSQCQALCADGDSLDEPESLLAVWAERVARWQEATEAQSRNTERLTDLERRREVSETRLAELNEAAEPRTAEIAALTADLTHERLERAALFEGRDAETVARELRERVEETVEAARKARDLLALEREELASLSEAVRHLRELETEREQAADRARTALETALTEKELTREDARVLADHDAAWLETSRRALDGAEREARDAETVVRERRERLAGHETENRPSADRDALSAEKRELEHARAESEETRHRARSTLEHDDRQREKSTALHEQIAAQDEVTRAWALMDDLIGAHDGAKLRRYAQSLTLDALLVYANRHLQTLAPRYSVERVPSAELDIQVRDAVMGDEVRPLSSLSGGETFLTALALALGLSTLSADRTPIGSMFIDEGFGSLDAKTLDIAVSALENLQASGLQIGVITHLITVRERLGTGVDVEDAGDGTSRILTT